jgi:peptide/nickel transport system substrate-binding protein
LALAQARFYKNKKPNWEASVRANRLRGKSAAHMILLMCIALTAVNPASAQKNGGTLRLYHNDNPPSASLLEESTIASVTPFAAVFNNLVVFDPFKVHESLDTVIPDLAESWYQADLQAARGREMA